MRNDTSDVSFYRNVFMNSLRSMQVSPVACPDSDCGHQSGLDYVQNVFFHFKTPLQFEEPLAQGSVNLIANYFHPVDITQLVILNGKTQIFADGNRSPIPLGFESALRKDTTIGASQPLLTGCHAVVKLCPASNPPPSA